jgi:hypothetical protein
MNPADLTVTKSGGAFWREKMKDGTYLVFRADDVRNQNTGIHAKVTVIRDQTKAESDTFNIGRRGERNSLANAAWERGFNEKIDGEDLIIKDEMRYKLMMFLDAVYPALQGEIRATELIADPTPVSFIARPHVVEYGGTILYAPGGKGKSTVLMMMAACVKYGLNHFWDVEKSNVLLVNLERSELSIARKWHGVLGALGLPEDEVLLNITQQGMSLTELADVIYNTVEKHSIDIVFLDSLTRAGIGDLTDAGPVNKFGDIMNHIAPTWVAIAHTSKADESRAYGSVMFENAADVMVQLTAQSIVAENKLGIRLDITKANDVPKNVPPLFIKTTYDPETLLLNGISDTTEYEFPELATGVVREGSLADQIEQYIVHDTPNAAASTKMIADHLSKQPSNISAILSKDKRFAKNTRQGREVFYSVVAQEAIEAVHQKEAT